MTTFWKNQKIFMNIKNMKNPKLGFESLESGEHFETISFFENFLKKVRIFLLLDFWADFMLFSLL